MRVSFGEMVITDFVCGALKPRPTYFRAALGVIDQSTQAVTFK